MNLSRSFTLLTCYVFHSHTYTHTKRGENSRVGRFLVYSLQAHKTAFILFVERAGRQQQQARERKQTVA